MAVGPVRGLSLRGLTRLLSVAGTAGAGRGEGCGLVRLLSEAGIAGAGRVKAPGRCRLAVAGEPGLLSSRGHCVCVCVFGGIRKSVGISVG